MHVNAIWIYHISAPERYTIPGKELPLSDLLLTRMLEFL